MSAECSSREEKARAYPATDNQDDSLKSIEKTLDFLSRLYLALARCGEDNVTSRSSVMLTVVDDQMRLAGIGDRSQVHCITPSAPKMGVCH